MKGFKVFNSDWTCKGYQFEVGKVFEENIKPICCKQGFHFCENLIDCFDYYCFNPSNKVAIVEGLGEIDREEDLGKICTNKIRIVEEISWYKVLDLVNIGKGNTGKENTGIGNTGNYNSGHYNSGDCNSGKYNTGDYNSGNCNTGDYNSGNCNSGDYNSGYYNSGCFNTKNSKLDFFNRPSNWTYWDWARSEASFILFNMPIDVIKDEKTEAYIKKNTDDLTRERQEWWDGLSDENKKEIYSLPNFDKGIFQEITGIKIEK